MYLSFCRNDRNCDTGRACLHTMSCSKIFDSMAADCADSDLTGRTGSKSRTLGDLAPGCHAIVSALLASGGMHRRLLDIGLTPGTRVECLGKSPLGDPSAFLIRGAVIALRKGDCRDILIEEPRQEHLPAAGTEVLIQNEAREE